MAPLAVTVAEPPHIVGLVTVSEGVGVTVTSKVAILLHPPVSPLTEYVVLLAGVAINVAPLIPEGTHVYVFAPLAVSVTVCPEQIEEPITVTVGRGFTKTVVVPEPLQPADERSTVYEVVVVGVTTIVLVLAPVFHV